MNNLLAPRVKETTTTTGTGTLSLAGAEVGFQSFVAGLGDGNYGYYTLIEGNGWEVGRGTVTAGVPDTLSRTTILASSNGGSALVLVAGAKDVFCSAVAQQFLFSPSTFENGKWALSTAANALTIELKTLAGNDPSPSNPVRVACKSVTNEGEWEIVEITTALSLVLSAGSTLGATANETIRGYIHLCWDGSNMRIGVARQALFDGASLHATTAEGGAGGADSNETLYTASALTNAAVRLVGLFEITSGATPGNWTADPSLVSVWTPGMRKTGDVVQILIANDNAFHSTTAVTIPNDDTIPTSSEGAVLFDLADSLTPTSAVNRIDVDVDISISASSSANIYVTFFMNAESAAKNTLLQVVSGINHQERVHDSFSFYPGSTAPLTMKTRFGTGGGTGYINGGNGSGKFGTSEVSRYQLTEVYS